MAPGHHNLSDENNCLAHATVETDGAKPPPMGDGEPNVESKPSERSNDTDRDAPKAVYYGSKMGIGHEPPKVIIFEHVATLAGNGNSHNYLYTEIAIVSEK